MDIKETVAGLKAIIGDEFSDSFLASEMEGLAAYVARHENLSIDQAIKGYFLGKQAFFEELRSNWASMWQAKEACRSMTWDCCRKAVEARG